MLYQNLRLGYAVATLLDQGYTDRQIRRSTGAPRQQVGRLRATARRMGHPSHSARMSVLMEYMNLRSVHGDEDIAAPSAAEAAHDLGENNPEAIEALFDMLGTHGMATRVPSDGQTPKGFIDPQDWEGRPSDVMFMLLDYEPPDETATQLQEGLLGSMTSLNAVRILLDQKSPEMNSTIPATAHTPRWPFDEITYIEFQPAFQLPPPPNGATCPGVLITKADPRNDPRAMLLPIAVNGRLHDIFMMQIDLHNGDIINAEGKRHSTPEARAATLPLCAVAKILSSPHISFRPAPLTTTQRRRLDNKGLPNPWQIPHVRHSP